MREDYINCFIETAIQSGGWMLLDKVYLRNRLVSLIGEWDNKGETLEECVQEQVTTDDLLNEMILIASENGKISADSLDSVEHLKSELLDLLTPPTSVVNALFSKHYDSSPKEATDYFYLLNTVNGYIEDNLKQDGIMVKNDSTWRIRQTKPAIFHDNECQQCFSSEGFGQKKNRTKRIIRMNLKGESWGFYYHPEPLITEHAIFSTEEHIPFVNSRQGHEAMLRLVDIFPHYFISFDPIKNEKKDHGFYFGGEATLPLIQAEDEYSFDIPGFVTVKASVVKWPLSVIRLRTTSKKNLLNSIDYLNLRWQQYSYPSLDIIASDGKGNTQHGMTPIFYKDGEDYVADLILRDISDAFSRTVAYKQLLVDPFTMIDLMGVVNVKDDLLLNDRLYDQIDENIDKQTIFMKDSEGEKAFIRFVDTL